jgi:diketogulonate reductase-like aldo/keto reductase
MSQPTRRDLLRALAAGTAAAFLSPLSAFAQPFAPLTRSIPSSGELLPVVGLGTWITFNVGDDPELRDECTAVMKAFFREGGRLIDSSPMYGSSQQVVGYALSKLERPSTLFCADKVWIGSGDEGPAQIEESRSRWGIRRFDLLQVHNLLAWSDHLPKLLAMKRGGRLRYVGITTSEGRRHGEIEGIMRREPIDFVQVSYNALDRDVESRILPLAQDRGIAVIVNRPFQQGSLIRHVARHRLPGWAADIGATSWAQLLLKFIISHPAVTCVIPATTQVPHVIENVRASSGPMPDAAMRARIATHVAQL